MPAVVLSVFKMDIIEFHTIIIAHWLILQNKFSSVHII